MNQQKLSRLVIDINNNETGFTCITTAYKSIVKYARLLKQPLTLGMFVPCDEDGDLMDYPDLRLLSKEEKKKVNERYQAALDRVIFEGFEVAKVIPKWCRDHPNRGRWKFNVFNEKKSVYLLFDEDGRTYNGLNECQAEISDLCGYGLKIKMR